MNRWPEIPPLPPPPRGVEPAPGTNICPDCSITEVPRGLEGHEFLRLNQASIDLAKTLPEAPPAKHMPGARTVPPEFEQLTLDGKITYARKMKRVFDSVLHYADGTQAAVGPVNTPLDLGFVLDPAGHVLSYMGTTIEEVEQLKMEQKKNGSGEEGRIPAIEEYVGERGADDAVDKTRRHQVGQVGGNPTQEAQKEGQEAVGETQE